ncbi:shikimate dehydrogenase [Frankia sp. CpI1-P]|nr:shikimate dehydrogenase [Frankia sp. CpI1-P]KQM03367.1 shikimate dehydrogenase [Frankia sp. CpI1-P]
MVREIQLGGVGAAGGLGGGGGENGGGGNGGVGAQPAAQRPQSLAAAATPAHPARAAVLGAPVDHSLSPVLHAAAYAELGLAVTYTAIHCDAPDLPAMVQRVRSDPDWVGLSLTMPLKTVAVDLLDEVDPTAAAIGAVNTVVVGEAGRLHGYNTDVVGIGVALSRVMRGAVPGQPLILGAGGTARAAVAAVAAAGCPHVAVVARRPEAVAEVVRIGARLGVEVTALPWELLATGLPAGPDLVIATTPAGATDPLATRRWPASSQLVELLYHPWPTALAAAAYRAGARVASGLEILAAQAVGQVEHFTGRRVPAGVLLAAGQAALDERRGADTAIGSDLHRAGPTVG